MPIPTIAERFHGRDNNFNLIRFLAASAVLLDHCVMLVRGDHPRLLDLGILQLDLYQVPIGRIAVDTFFVVSGFLVMRSVLTRPSVLDFGIARILRLLPALIVACLATAFLLGPAVTSLPLGAYFADPATWTYVPITSALISHSRELPGVFDSVPVANIVNSPLWTLRYESFCYLVLAVLALSGALLSNRIAYALAGLLTAYLLVSFATPWRGDLHAVDSLCRFGLSFFIGGSLFVFRHRIPLHWAGVAALILLAWFTAETPLGELTFRLALGYGAVWAALVPVGAIRGFNRVGDYSYGLYIFCWPIQQAIITLMPDIAAPMLFALSFPITLALAALSWHLVEHPALRQKERASQFAAQTLDWLKSRTLSGGKPHARLPQQS